MSGAGSQMRILLLHSATQFKLDSSIGGIRYGGRARPLFAAADLLQ